MSDEIVEQPVAESTEKSLEDRIAEKLFGPSEEQEEAAEEQQPEDAGDQPAEETPQEPEVVEVEFNGKQYKVPAEIKDSLMAQSDYTRKTQEVAEQRRLLDQQVMIQQQESQFRQAVEPEVDQLKQLDSQIKQYKALDWSSMDFETMTRTRMAMEQVKDARDEIKQTLEQKREQFNQYRQKVLSEVTQKGHEYLKKHIPNWSQDVGQELTKYGIQEGYSDVELSNLNDPRIIKTLWKARQWDALQSQKGVVKVPTKAAPSVKPGANTKSTQQLDDMNYQKALKSAKSSSEKERIILARLEKRWA